MIRRSDLDLFNLRKKRVACVAAASDRLVQKCGLSVATSHISRAYRPVDNEPRYLRDGSMLYLPKHGLDWEPHPHAHKALELLFFQFDVRGEKSVSWMRTGRVFFVLSEQWVSDLLSGDKEELDLLAALESGLEEED